MGMDEEIKEIRIRQEDYIFGVIAYPRHPLIHRFILTFIGALAVVYDIYGQIPANIKDLENVEIDPNTWYAFPFIFMSIVIDDKKLYRKLCNEFRKISREEKKQITEDELYYMAEEGMRGLIRIRFMSCVVSVLGWFVLFNLMFIGLIYYLGL